MRNRIAAAAAAVILTIGMAALPSAASASEIAPNADGLAGSTTISGQIDQDMAVCTDKTCDAVQHVRKTNQQIKSDIDTAKHHAELKTKHDAFAASSHQWHQSFIAALKDANSKTGQQGGSSVATGTHGTTAGTNAGTTVTGANGTTGTVRTAADTGTNPSQRPAIKPPHPPAR